MIFQERTYSVLLVSASEKFNASMMPLLPVTDYWPVTVAKSIGEARRRMVDESYDIVIINSPLPDDFGTRFAIHACANSNAGVLLLVKNSLYEDVDAKVLPYGVVTLSMPTNHQMVSQSLRVLCAIRERLRQVEAKQTSLEERMREIRMVNQAKWRLIECLNMTEADAHRYIEKQAMDLRVPKREVAESIIKTYPKI